MKRIDTCQPLPYSALVPALQAFFTAPKGEELEIVMNDRSAFSDYKKFLTEQNIGFREVYINDFLILQFTIPNS